MSHPLFAKPLRSSDTMSEAIALSSPNGRMSDRARRDANERLRVSLFGKEGLQREAVAQPAERDRDLAKAKELRGLAARGMNTRKYTKEAERLESKWE